MTTVRPAYAIAIPARDEEARVVACLEACRIAMARWPRPGVIALLVNNSRDHTVARAMAWARTTGGALRLAERHFPDEAAHAGTARRASFDFARAQLGSHGFLLTTDADSRPDPEWIGASLAPLEAGRAAMVCGAMELDPAEFARLPSWATDRGAVEDRYRRTALELASLLDPDPLNPWPFHGTISGANLAMSAAAYDRIGGAPILPHGEDRALVRRFLDHDLPVFYSDASRVVTSCRLEGRAPGGMADTIASRLAGGPHWCDEALEPARQTEFRARARARLRQAFREPRQRDEALALAGLSVEQRRQAPFFTGFGALWAFVETISPRLARHRMSWDEMAAELPRLERLRDDAAAARTRARPAGEIA
ncbi:glycosyltransferase [Gluconacetobacter sacchari]|uniref:Glycosyltransferase n=2 Tax=Gluconacetobacter sacchari TaxID=92759 RepID=A0A7W4IGL9_9PROT|nr:glycosyltransferase [Gluconacetobacter sacchari]MBB2162504.1 glycosyltransferase [Gluconacetobacter sacchari]GBQ32597.1 glycosyltransferase [Gluconacetobacter sacchari DSM 12717]